MNDDTLQLRALLIAPTDAALARACQRLANKSGLSEFAIATVTEAKLLGYLQEFRTGDDLPLVVLLDAQLSNSAAVIRHLQNFSEHSSLLFITDTNQPLEARRRLAHLPLGKAHWVLLDLEDTDCSATLLEAARAAQQRRRLRSTLDRANRQLSDYQQAERPLARSAIADHYLTSFLAQSQDAIVAIDPAERVLYWSAGAARLFGRSADDAVGCAARELPFWSDQLRAQLAELSSGSATLTTESHFALNGEQMAIESLCSAVRNEQGDFVGTLLAVRDVTERHRLLEAERAERTQVVRTMDRERRYLLNLFKQAPGFIAVFKGPNHVFEVVNDAYLQLVGRRSVLGKAAGDALPELQGQQFLTLLDQVYARGTAYLGRGMPVSVKSRSDNSLTTLYVDFVFQPIVEEDGTVTGIFCQGSDITQHRLTQQKLAKHQAQLEQLVQERTQALQASQQALQRSQKLEAIGQLTGGVAHDFNNVLQIIASNLQLLQMGALDQTQKQAFLGAALDAVERGTKLSSQLLAFARRQPLQPVSVNLNQVLRGMGDLLHRALGETIEIETVTAPGLWNTLIDPNRLENVILNLCINARDAMPNGGRLTMELGNAMLDDEYVKSQPDVPAGDYVLLAISDTGTGMSPEVLERVFDPFFTTKKEGEGTGLGLSMAYGFVKQSGGHIKVYSEQGCGTTFKLYLPRSCQQEVEVPRQPEGPVVGGSETVLVVEDDAAVREAAVFTLKGLGYQVLKAADGQSALSVLNSGIAIDLLFTDVVMPGHVRSPELARQAKALFPTIAVLFTSGYTQNAIVHSGRLDVGVELLSKPYRREDLARKVRQVLSQQGQAAPTPPPAERAIKLAPELKILLVEDDTDSRLGVCSLLKLLGHQIRDVASAEEALQMLQAEHFDLLFTDIRLPGMSGVELAKEAVVLRPDLKLVIASGYGAEIQLDLQPAPVILPKPFNLKALQQALSLLNEE